MSDKTQEAILMMMLKIPVWGPIIGAAIEFSSKQAETAPTEVDDTYANN